MLKRIVRMEFEEDRVADFLELFEEVKSKIQAQQGCSHLELCRDASFPNVYYTYSMWASEDHLNGYRDSELFKETWKRTKELFSGKPQAFSLVEG